MEEENEKENVFKKFYRIDNYLTSSAQGSGLGLYIAKSLIEKMNGKIEINSPKEENFTEFLIYITLLEPEKFAKKAIGQKQSADFETSSANQMLKTGDTK